MDNGTPEKVIVSKKELLRQIAEERKCLNIDTLPRGVEVEVRYGYHRLAVYLEKGTTEEEATHLIRALVRRATFTDPKGLA